MDKKIIGIGFLIFVAFGALAWVWTGTTAENENTERPLVVVSIYPLAYVVESIAGDTVEVSHVGAGVDPHEYTPSVQDTKKLSDAGLVVVMGGGLEHWAEDIESARAQKGASFLAMNEIVSVYVANESSAEEYHDEAHGHDGIDPHSWLDTQLMQQMAHVVRDELSHLYPAHAEMYAKNTETLVAELSAINRAFVEGLAQCAAGEALTSHDAFGYIGRRYNLDMHPIVGISTNDEPSAQLLAELREEAREGVVGILTEQRSIKKYAETLARETGLQLLSVDAMELGVPKGATYASVMYENLNAFRTAYGCQ